MVEQMETNLNLCLFLHDLNLLAETKAVAAVAHGVFELCVFGDFSPG